MGRAARRPGVPAAAGSHRAVTAADDEREHWHARVRDGVHELGAVLGDAAGLGVPADHEAGDVLQEDQRHIALAAELHGVEGEGERERGREGEGEGVRESEGEGGGKNEGDGDGGLRVTARERTSTKCAPLTGESEGEGEGEGEGEDADLHKVRALD